MTFPWHTMCIMFEMAFCVATRNCSHQQWGEKELRPSSLSAMAGCIILPWDDGIPLLAEIIYQGSAHGRHHIQRLHLLYSMSTLAEEHHSWSLLRYRHLSYTSTSRTVDCTSALSLFYWHDQAKKQWSLCGAKVQPKHCHGTLDNHGHPSNKWTGIHASQKLCPFTRVVFFHFMLQFIPTEIHASRT